ncbi:MAG: CHAT domain-containing protein, partial [Bacteroidota bacterium]
DILHFAMHGLVDSKDSEKSRLVFTPVEDSVHDNYLHNFELYNLSIDAKLAVLSACNTGYGKLEGSEGVMSLARAFTYAGTKSVVMSQWPADDEATSVIMQSFYSYLADGKRKDDALRLAKLDYLAQADPSKRNPFYWNNFVVMGDVSPLVKDNTKLYIYIGLFILGILLLVVFGIRFFAKRRIL